MLALGVTYAQHLGAANQYAPPPEITSRVVNDRILNAAMLHEFPTGIKRFLFPITAPSPGAFSATERNAVQGTTLDIEEHFRNRRRNGDLARSSKSWSMSFVAGLRQSRVTLDARTTISSWRNSRSS
jgi:hypothetical protein